MMSEEVFLKPAMGGGGIVKGKSKHKSIKDFFFFIVFLFA